MLGGYMEINRLGLVLSLKFCHDAEHMAVGTFYELYSKYSITEVDFKRAIFMNALRRRAFEGRVIGYIDKTQDVYGIIFNWCIIYSRMWERDASWSRFVEYSGKHGYKNVIEIPNWETETREYFDFIYQLVDETQGTWIPPATVMAGATC